MNGAEALLARAFVDLRPPKPNGSRGHWSVPLAAGVVRIDLEPRWASLQLQADAACARAPLDSLWRQSGWPGCVKIAAPEAGGGVSLRADVPLVIDSSAGRDWVVAQLRSSLEGLKAAAGYDASPADPASSASGAPTDPESLALACPGAGWTAAVKPDGSVGIELSLRGVPRTVTLRPLDGSIHASVALPAGLLGRASAPCRAAAAVQLMRATSALRWARAFATSAGGAPDSVGFECVVVAPVHAPALQIAVDTLIAACELFGRETELLLESPEIAAIYASSAPECIEKEIDSTMADTAQPAPMPTVPAAAAALAS